MMLIIGTLIRNMNSLTSYRCAFILLCLSSFAMSNDTSTPLDVVPEHERLASDHPLKGPTRNKGIESVKNLGVLSLDNEFASSKDRILRAREITMAPGGVVAVHKHDSRPGVAYILEGEVLEHRADSKQPLLRKQGQVSFENTGVTHWWENRTDKIVRALVVDIIKEGPE